jgi:predicted dehydrogenase
VHAQFISIKPSPDPRDSISVLFKFEREVSGVLGAVRASPFYWRVHVFGDQGSVEALGETQLVVRRRGGQTEVCDFAPRDSLLAEFEAFADAVAGSAPYPISPSEMVDTIGAFEAITRSLEERKPVRVDTLK